VPDYAAVTVQVNASSGKWFFVDVEPRRFVSFARAITELDQNGRRH
jgi:hypothetical protein